MESNPTRTLGIGYPILCAYFCLGVDIFPDMGSWGSKKASHSSGLLFLGCGQELLAPSHGQHGFYVSPSTG